MKKWKIFLGFIFLVILIFVGILIYKNKSKIVSETPIKIAYLKETGFSYVFVAKEKGFYKEAGLNVELVEVDSKQLLDVILNNRVDVTSTGLASIAGLENEKSGLIKIFGGAGETINGEIVSALLVTKDSPIQKISDLKGKTIGTDAAKNIAGIKLFISKNGMDPEKDVKIIEVGKEIIAQALLNKQVDAVYAHQPTTTILMVKFDARTIETNLRARYTVDPYINAPLGVVTTEFYQKNPDVIKKLFNTYDQSVKFIRENPEETKLITSKYTPQLNSDIATKVGMVYMVSPKEKIDFNKMDIIINSLVEAKILKNKINIRDLFILP